MKVSEAADLLGKSARHIQRLVKDGKLTASKDTKGHYVLVEDEVRKLSGKPRMEVSGKPGSRRYLFAQGSVAVNMAEADYQGIRQAYSNWTGTPQHIDQLCAEYRLTRAEFAVVRTAGGFTHTSAPFTDEALAERPAGDLHAELMQANKKGLQRKFARGKDRETKKAAARWWAFEDSAEALIADLAQGLVDKLPKVQYTPTTKEDADYLAVLAPTDWHYGKLATEAFGKGAYDRKIAVERLLSYSADVLDRLVKNHGKAVKVVLYVGSDGVQMDTWNGTTTRGTRQDTDGHPAEIATGALYAWYQLVELVRSKVARVEIRANAGNHDRLLTHVTLAALDISYRDTPDVTVATRCPFYDYVAWGQTLVMFHHGDGTGKLPDLASIASTQEPRLWGACPHRYVLTGHRHHAVMVEGKGMRLIQLPSMAGSDAYHQLNWAAGHRPTLLVPVFHKVDGLVTIHERGAVWDHATQDWV